jgi:hypothetical protein
VPRGINGTLLPTPTEVPYGTNGTNVPVGVNGTHIPKPTEVPYGVNGTDVPGGINGTLVPKPTDVPYGPNGTFILPTATGVPGSNGTTNGTHYDAVRAKKNGALKSTFGAAGALAVVLAAVTL